MSGVSYTLGKSTILKWLKDLGLDNINSILDIGVGSGTYYHYLNDISCKWEGIEIWEPYIAKYNLENFYDKIYNVDAKNFDWSNKSYDLVIAGDVLEHMSKKDSIELINKALSHSKYCIISIPVVWYPQGALDGNHYETHVKDDWTHYEVLSSFPYIKRAMTDDIAGVYLLSKTLEINFFDETNKKTLARNKTINKRVADIKNLYITILGRESDLNGLEYYVRSNFTIEEIKNIFLSSDEYKKVNKQ